MKRVILLAVGLLCVFAAAYAVPAKRGFYRYVQPDGSIVAARLVGDESGHYYVSEDGCPMLMDSLGTMCHAAIVNGRLTAGAPVRRWQPRCDGKNFVRRLCQSIQCCGPGKTYTSGRGRC